MGFSWTVSSKFWNIGSSGVTDGGKFLLTYWEKRGKEKRENGEEKKENQNREGGKLKMEGEKVTKWGEDFFVFVFVFVFSKPLKFVLGLPKWEFSAGKKMTLLALKNIPLTPLIGSAGGGILTLEGGHICVALKTHFLHLFCHSQDSQLRQESVLKIPSWKIIQPSGQANPRFYVHNDLSALCCCFQIMTVWY